MLFPWLLIGIFLILIAPVQLGAIVLAGKGPVQGKIGAMIWGIAFQLHLAFIRDEQGQLRLENIRKKKKKKHKKNLKRTSEWLLRAIKALLKADHARGLMHRGISLTLLEGDIRLHTQDAALTAVLSAALQTLAAYPKKIRIHIAPSFQDHTALRFRCIVACRLGTLLAACLMGYISYRRSGKKEEKSWNILSDA